MSSDDAGLIKPREQLYKSWATAHSASQTITNSTPNTTRFSRSHVLSKQATVEGVKNADADASPLFFFSFSHSIHIVEGGMGGSEERKWHTEERIKSWWKKIHEKQLGIQHLCCFFFFQQMLFFSCMSNVDMEREVGGGCWGNRRRRRRIHRRLNLLLSSAVIEQNKDRTQYSFNPTTFTKRVKPLTLVTVSTG